eukprot:7309320-Pyramimonas_sp.AAC.1
MASASVGLREAALWGEAPAATSSLLSRLSQWIWAIIVRWCLISQTPSSAPRSARRFLVRLVGANCSSAYFADRPESNPPLDGCVYPRSRPPRTLIFRSEASSGDAL